MGDHAVTTERVKFRTASVADASVIVSMMTAGISKWVASWPYPLSLHQAQTILKTVGKDVEAGQCHAFIASKAEIGTDIGWLKIAKSDFGTSSWEIGYWIAEDHQGCGFAKDITRFALRFCFEELGAGQVMAGAQVENEISLNLLKKMGFRYSHYQEVFAPARQRTEECEYRLLDRCDWKVAD